MQYTEPRPDYLECTGGEVAGGYGTSGETTAEVYLIIKFKDAQGNVIETKTTGYKLCSCIQN